MSDTGNNDNPLNSEPISDDVASWGLYPAAADSEQLPVSPTPTPPPAIPGPVPPAEKLAEPIGTPKGKHYAAVPTAGVNPARHPVYDKSMAFGAISIVVPFIAFIVLIFWVVGISGTPGAQATNVFCLLCIPAFFFGLAAVITGRRRIKASPGDGVGSGAITAGIIGMFACVPLAIIGTLVGFLVVYAATYNGGNGGY